MKKMTTQLEKGATAFTAVVCLFLFLNFLNMVIRGGVRASAPRPTLTAVQNPKVMLAARAPHRAPDELARYDPELNLEELKELDARPLPEVKRNPFEFPPAGPAPQAAAATAVNVPPPAPPLPLQAVGFTQAADGKPEALIKDGEDLYVVATGETFAKRYRVLSLSPSKVEVQDVTTGQVAQLPIPE